MKNIKKFYDKYMVLAGQYGVQNAGAMKIKNPEHRWRCADECADFTLYEKATQEFIEYITTHENCFGFMEEWGEFIDPHSPHHAWELSKSIIRKGILSSKNRWWLEMWLKPVKVMFRGDPEDGFLCEFNFTQSEWDELSERLSLSSYERINVLSYGWLENPHSNRFARR